MKNLKIVGKDIDTFANGPLITNKPKYYGQTDWINIGSFNSTKKSKVTGGVIAAK